MNKQEETGAAFTKIAVLENEIEAQVISLMLDEQGIPYVIKSYHDTAFDGLFQMQKGWGAIYSSESHRQDILEIISSVSSGTEMNTYNGKNIS